MKHAVRALAVLALAGWVAIPAVHAQTVRPFPMRIDADYGDRGMEWSPIPEALAELERLDAVDLEGVPIPGRGRVRLQLHRVAVSKPSGRCFVDGAAEAGPIDAGTSLWSGRVAGEAGSEAFLAFSRHGTRGWIEREGSMTHVLAVPHDGIDWSAPRSLVVPQRLLEELGLQPQLTCGASPAPRNPSAPASGRAALGATPGAPLPLYECTVAVETDWQFFQLFGDVEAAKAYALALFGAVSTRYREQIGTILTLPYLGLYTNPNDPWVAAENGGGSVGLLNEFQNAWKNGGAPVPANLHHFLSGTISGGGIAYLGTLCDATYGFGVSGNIGGTTPIPIAQGPLNWDFMVVAHEIGHNFSSPHTHAFCPPLDECPPQGFWGPCQTQQSCTSQGTLMSYCHLCPGGVANITTLFHPQCVALMRAAVLASCLPAFKGIVGTKSLGYALNGAHGTPSLEVAFAPRPDALSFSVAGAPSGQLGILIVSPSTLFAPLLGGTMVPALDLFNAGLVSDATGDASLSIPVPLSIPGGLVLFAQTWFLDGSGFAATNAEQFELILP